MLKSFRRGDTLIEVTLAIGVFSLVAVSAVSILGSSTSSAEDTLETSITREQIDAQADALRFIHSAAQVDNATATPKFANLWKKITDGAITIRSDWTTQQVEQLLQYAPNSCAENYPENDTNPNSAYNKAFLIDPNQLGAYSEASLADADKMLKGNSIFITNKSTYGTNSRKILAQTTTYPRLVYAGADDSSLLGADIAGNLSAAEGIYVVGVKDSRTSTDKADYYDFYIRTCWYGVDSERPSTISTVIRLNDLDATKYDIEEKVLAFRTNDDNAGEIDYNFPNGSHLLPGKEIQLTARVTKPGFKFIGWYDSRNGNLVSQNTTYSCIIGNPNCNTSVTAKFAIEIKVLNVYPPNDPAPTIPGATANSLKGWMEKWGINDKDNDGTKKLIVDPVPIASFNANPRNYIGNPGSYKYDIIVFGFWDYNGKADLNANSAAIVREFINNKGGVLFGHDTLDASSCDSSGAYFHPYFYSLIDLMALECIESGNHVSDKVKIVENGVFTQYPYQIGRIGDVLTIPPAHRTRFRSHGTVWLRFIGDTNWEKKPASDDFYLASYGHTAFINTGHSNGQATNEERKIIANILFYLYQLDK